MKKIDNHVLVLPEMTNFHKKIKLGTSIKTIEAITKSWKCCKCRAENYNNMFVCSWCRHDRCSSCRQLEG